ncbi:hypothetical protein DICPUDRAFT_160189 [Dictyostelium purpureum]|uniref:Uncharacterized protein n=1 Tax=Dictyostelium purpureum TaxID=5786 RepID=F1A5W0_DICPU|nr:uncharacterized protein DICPUDRAFT_160189 [Dictyostelium purpureum]EGC28418.1 hypothetical protein DICPUDRAFT_160189 [Dictyostelium purpureum]|eukprot:XP_003295054.1 hypothetical protein DICPUDRAFT_160189 [Dictyostelium purpureum]
MKKQCYNSRPIEILFWEVIRGWNKYLFRKIFSNFNFSNAFIYERLDNAKYILKSFKNGEEIVRDKVKCADYLTQGGLNQVYSVIRKNTSENVKFYTQLFTNYQRYYQIPEELFSFIENSNKMALKLYVRRFRNRDEEITRIIQRYPKENIQKLSQTYRGIKMLNFLRKHYSVELSGDIGHSLFEKMFISDLSTISLKNLIKLTKCLLDIYNNKNNNNNNNNININNDNKDSVQNYLIENNNNISNIDYTNSNHFSSIFEEIKLYNFTKEELSIDFMETLRLRIKNI